jgi:hypothetical protein
MNERLKTILAVIGVFCLCLIAVSTISGAAKPTPTPVPNPLEAVWKAIGDLQSASE